MKRLGSTIVACAGGGLALCSAAAAQPFNVSCVKGADERTIEILAPGDVGAACDVRYARFGGSKTPYHANNSTGFCREKADEIVATLITSGFACGQIGGPLTAEARSSSSTPQAANLAPPEPVEEPTPEPTAPPDEMAQVVEAAPVLESGPEYGPEPVTEHASEPAQKSEPAPIDIAPPAEERVAQATLDDIARDGAENGGAVEEPAPVAPGALNGAAPIEDPFSPPALPTTIERETLKPIAVDDSVADHASTSLAETGADRLNEPAVRSVATQGPAPLARDDLEELQRAAEPIPAGRLVGAAPSLTPAPQLQPQPQPQPQLGAPPTNHAAQSTSAPTPPTPAAVVAAAPAQPSTLRPSTLRPSGLRDPEEIIVATLSAQVAAWNEGNLQAFMETYWKDADLKFVSGTAITKGWSPTMKRYRERYADPSGLGQLAMEKTDVEMVTDDVAIVTGRFNHVKNETSSSGVFTLVMKRVAGVWRIVHDHTVSDAP